MFRPQISCILVQGMTATPAFLFLLRSKNPYWQINARVWAACLCACICLHCWHWNNPLVFWFFFCLRSPWVLESLLLALQHKTIIFFLLFSAAVTQQFYPTGEKKTWMFWVVLFLSCCTAFNGVPALFNHVFPHYIPFTESSSRTGDWPVSYRSYL